MGFNSGFKGLMPGCPDGILCAKNTSCLQIFYLIEPVTFGVIQIFNYIRPAQPVRGDFRSENPSSNADPDEAEIKRRTNFENS